MQHLCAQCLYQFMVTCPSSHGFEALQSMMNNCFQSYVPTSPHIRCRLTSISFIDFSGEYATDGPHMRAEPLGLMPEAQGSIPC